MCKSGSEFPAAALTVGRRVWRFPNADSLDGSCGLRYRNGDGRSSGPGWRRRLCAVVGVPAVVVPSAAFGMAAAVVGRFAAVALGGGVEPWSTLLTDVADRSWRHRRWRMSAPDVRRRESRRPTHRR